MWKNVVNIGHHYFHNVDMSKANIHIMKIMLTDIHHIMLLEKCVNKCAFILPNVRTFFT